MRKQALYYKAGDWNADCDRCGFTYKASQLKKEWTGLRVCRECFDVRHPQDFLRGKPDRQAPAWTRPPDEEATTFGVAASLADESNNVLADESGNELTEEGGNLATPEVRPEDL